MSEPPKVALFRTQLESFTDEVHAAVAVLSLGTTADVANHRCETIRHQYSLIVIPPTLKFSPDRNVAQAVEIIEADLAVIALQVSGLVTVYEQFIEVQASKDGPLRLEKGGQVSAEYLRYSGQTVKAKAEMRSAAEKKGAELSKILVESLQIIKDSVASIEQHVLHNFRKPFPRVAGPAAE